MNILICVQGLNQGPKIKVPVVGTTSLNLAEFASKAEEKDFELNIPLISCSAAEPHPSLCVCPGLVSSLMDFAAFPFLFFNMMEQQQNNVLIIPLVFTLNRLLYCSYPLVYWS